MTKSEVIALLAANADARGIAHWEKLGDGGGGLESFGIGLTKLRKLAKQVGRDHELAQALWASDNHDVKIIGLLIDEPKKLTREQAEAQVEQVGAGMLSHVFSSCDATLAKSPLALDLAKEWIASKDALRRRCGYGLVYELSKNMRNKALTDGFFLDCLARIRAGFGSEDGSGRGAMGGALLGIGKRNRVLTLAAIPLATEFGPINFGEGGAGCEPMDVLKHLTNDSLQKRLGN